VGRTAAHLDIGHSSIVAPRCGTNKCGSGKRLSTAGKGVLSLVTPGHALGGGTRDEPPRRMRSPGAFGKPDRGRASRRSGFLHAGRSDPTRPWSDNQARSGLVVARGHVEEVGRRPEEGAADTCQGRVARGSVTVGDGSTTDS
jgi:hypothetical protein